MEYCLRKRAFNTKHSPMTTAKIIFIHPPVVKPSEPPAGIARLSACLKANGVEHRVIDSNVEGLLYLLRFAVQNGGGTGRWDIRARKNLEANLDLLHTPEAFQNKSRYSRAVMDIHRVLQTAGKPCGVHLSLSDYEDSLRSPVKSADLIQAAEQPEANPFYSYFSGRLTQALEESPDFIGFSMNFLSQALCTMAMIGFVKKIHPRQKIILGGSLTTSWIRLAGRTDLFSGLVDRMVEGAGEEKLPALLGIPCHREGLSADYDLFEKNRYFSPGFILPYSAARGCWWRKCSFCPEKSEAAPYLPLPASRAAEELGTLTKQTGPSLIHLLDSSVSPAFMQALIENPPGSPWYGFARVTRHLADKDFCRALKKSGCVMLKLGLESGSQSVLDDLSKGIDLDEASAALRTLNKAGIAVYGYFLFGTPQETEADAQKTLDFIVRHSGCISFLNLAIFNLPAGSEEARDLSTQEFYDGDLSLYRNFHHPSGWQRGNVRNFINKTLKKHPAVAPIAWRTPEFFTSNHAPFFAFLKNSK
jgi:hypothetical protein